MKNCPYCGGEIKDAAIKCKHCREMIGNAKPTVTELDGKSLPSNAVYLSIDGQQKGPFEAEQLRAMWSAGTITAQTMAWQEGLPEWVSFKQIANTAGIYCTPPPPPPKPTPPPRPVAVSSSQPPPSVVKQCPSCGGEILDAQVKCEHCEQLLTGSLICSNDPPSLKTLITVVVIIGISGVILPAVFQSPPKEHSITASVKVHEETTTPSFGTWLKQHFAGIASERDVARQKVDAWLEKYIAGQAPYEVQGVSGYSLVTYKIIKSSNGIVTVELIFKNQRGGDVLETHNFHLNNQGEVERLQ